MGRRIAYINWLGFIPLLVLCAFSLTIIRSISPELFWQQFFSFVIGFILFGVMLTIDYKIFVSIWSFLYISVLVILLTSFLGPNVRGATRWLSIGGVRIQPSELVKPLLLLSQAAYLSQSHKMSIGRVITFLILFFVPALFVFKQPDLGNTIIYLGSSLGLLFVSSTPFIYICLFLLGGTGFIPLVWYFLQDFQKQRIVSFLNPQHDVMGVGYNAIQAMIAVGSGGIWGRGIGRGPQSHLRFLPENHTDFIFASLTEELGFIGGSLLIITYFVLLTQIFLTYRRSGNSFSQYIALGIFIQLFLQIVINIGMNLGVLPITGITLPLVSYGGNSILSTFISLGLLQRISMDNNQDRDTIAIR